MAGGDYFYEGADYGFDPAYGGTSQAYSSNPAAGIGLQTDPRTANILKVTSEKLNTGATAVEITQLTPEIFESIPKEHFKELNRLRKLLGNNVELTLHAPIVEPTGLTKRGHWEPYEREQAEKQMIDAVQKAHDLNPQGNVVTTFHSSAIGMPEETRIWEEVEFEGKKKKVEVVKEAYVFDERTGELAPLPGKLSVFEGEKKFEVQKKIDTLNRDHWYKTLQHINYGADQGAKIIEGGLKEGVKLPEKEAEESEKIILDIYKDYAKGDVDKVEKKIKEFGMEGVAKGGEFKIKDAIQNITHGDIYLRDAYSGLRDMFDQAYDSLNKAKEKGDKKAGESLQRLDKFKTEIQPKLDYLKKPENVNEFAEALKKGVDLLRSVDAPPIYKPFKDFAIDKSSDTFSNVALSAYKQFKENAPIISIENPPAGFMISRADELKKLVEESRRKFEDKAVKDLGLSRSKAKEEAEKLIGATWDVGHINMIRKYGAGKEEVVTEARKIAPVVKHIHLSDNFGFEHAEIPMGMGNVPTKEIMKEMMEQNKKYEKIKKIAEVGGWYQHFQTTPFAETLRHFGSPIYAMEQQPYWGRQSYFAGYGMNPEIHHAMYGAGFANLPVELGGQMAGRSRVSGNPLE